MGCVEEPWGILVDFSRSSATRDLSHGDRQERNSKQKFREKKKNLKFLMISHDVGNGGPIMVWE